MLAVGLSVLLTVSAISQDFPCDSIQSHTLVHTLGISLGFDYVASSISDEIRDQVSIENPVLVHTALPAQIKYSFSFTDPRIRNYLPGGYQGIGLGLKNFGSLQAGGFSHASKYIGNPLMLYVFQGGPFHHFNSKLSFDYEWNFGASFGWKPYSTRNENFNLTVGSKVNAYLNLSIGLRWRLNDHLDLFGGVAVSHFSNGNTKWPNPGINTFGVRIGMVWTVNPLSGDFPVALPPPIKKRKVEYDISAWVSFRRRLYRGGEEPVMLKGKYGCAGLSFAPMFRLGRWWRIGGSADLQWDESSDLKKYYVEGSNPDDIKFFRPPFGRQLSFGISAHGELQMPIFAVNVGVGYNLLTPPENKGLYQNITLKTYIGSKFFINVGYQLRNFHQQSNLMLGLGVSI